MERAVSLEKAFAAYGQAALARRIHICKQTVHGWKKAKRGLPQLAQILISKVANEDNIDVWVDAPKRGARRKKAR